MRTFTITVGELLDRLASVPRDARVLISAETEQGHEYHDIDDIQVKPLAEYWCYGCSGFIDERGLPEPPSPGAGKSGWFSGPDEFEALVLS